MDSFVLILAKATISAIIGSILAFVVYWTLRSEEAEGDG